MIECECRMEGKDFGLERHRRIKSWQHWTSVSTSLLVASPYKTTSIPKDVASHLLRAGPLTSICWRSCHALEEDAGERGEKRHADEMSIDTSVRDSRHVDIGLESREQS